MSGELDGADAGAAFPENAEQTRERPTDSGRANASARPASFDRERVGISNLFVFATNSLVVKSLSPDPASFNEKITGENETIYRYVLDICLGWRKILGGERRAYRTAQKVAIIFSMNRALFCAALVLTLCG